MNFSTYLCTATATGRRTQGRLCDQLKGSKANTDQRCALESAAKRLLANLPLKEVKWCAWKVAFMNCLNFDSLPLLAQVGVHDLNSFHHLRGKAPSQQAKCTRCPDISLSADGISTKASLLSVKSAGRRPAASGNWRKEARPAFYRAGCFFQAGSRT